MSTDDSICESSLNPNKSSGDIGELRPCPFCGRGYVGCYNNIARIESESNTKRWVLECSSCAVTFHAENNESQEEVLAWWNTRAPDPESAAEIERLRREVGDLRESSAIHESYCEKAMQSYELAAGVCSQQADVIAQLKLTAESAVAAAWEEAAKIAAGHADAILKRAQIHPTEGFINGMLGANASLVRSVASAIRTAVSKKTTED